MSSNLDAELNKLGFEIVDEIEKQDKRIRKNLINHIDKALGVLANDGVYAYYVFCLSKDKEGNNENNSKKLYKEIFIEKVKDKLEKFLPIKYRNERELQNFFEKLSEELHDLLFFKDALERALIYARYHAKTLGDKDE